MNSVHRSLPVNSSTSRRLQSSFLAASPTRRGNGGIGAVFGHTGGTRPPSNMPEVIDNKFRIVRTLGKGGNGTVYVAWNESLQKEVAVKVLTEAAPEGLEVKRFQQEARALSTCQHPGIVHVASFGLTEDNRPYYVMDFIDGISLAAEINEHGPLAPKRFVAIFDEVLDALEHAHSLGLIHRDIKPSNIMLTTSGGTDAEVRNERAVLIDFGLTRSLQQNVRLTATEALVGTPYYMSPEQCMGKPVDQRGDLYSLGCTMLEAATGKPPFGGEALEVLMNQIGSAPDTVPLELLPLLEGMLAKDPDKRFPNAKSTRETLHSLQLERLTQFTTGKHALGHDEQRQQAHRTQKKANWLAVSAAAAVAIALGGAFVYYSSHPLRSADATMPPPAKRWQLFQKLAEDQESKGSFTEASAQLEKAIKEIEREDPSDKFSELNLIQQLSEISVKDWQKPTVWEPYLQHGIELADELNLPARKRDLQITMGRLYTMQKNPAGARSAFIDAVKTIDGMKTTPTEPRYPHYLVCANYVHMTDDTLVSPWIEKMLRDLLTLERNPQFSETVAFTTEPGAFGVARYYKPTADLTFVNWVRKELDTPVKEPTRAIRRLVWHANFDEYANDRASANRHFEEAYQLALRQPFKPNTLAAWVLHEQLARPEVGAKEKVRLASQALKLCTTGDLSGPYVADALSTAYSKVAVTNESAANFKAALEARRMEAKYATRIADEPQTSTMEVRWNWRRTALCAYCSAAYDAYKIGDKHAIAEVQELAANLAKVAEYEHDRPMWTADLKQIKQQFEQAQRGVKPPW